MTDLSTSMTTSTTNNSPSDNGDDEKALITTLSPKAQRFVHLYMTGQYSIPKLAQLLDMHPNTLWKWLKRDDIQRVIQDMQTSTHDVVSVQLGALTLKAVNKLSELIDSPIDGVAYQAVRDVLDRGGHKPKNEMKIEKTVTTYEQRLNNLIENVIDIDVESGVDAD